MIDLRNKKSEDIALFLLNNKKADCLALDADMSDNNKSSFTQREIYKDKHMTIVYSYLTIEEDDIIQQFTIESNWWGRIKNSFFTLDGFSGKTSRNVGIVNITDLENYNTGRKVPVNNRNQKVGIDIIDFSTLVQYCQRVMKASPSYKVVRVVSLSPNPWVVIEITMPDGTVHLHEGTSKKDAANKFAVKYSKEIEK